MHRHSKLTTKKLEEIEVELPSTQNIMDQLRLEIKNVPDELISLPESAYRANNFNVEMVQVLEKKSLQLSLDPGYLERLKEKYKDVDEDHQKAEEFQRMVSRVNTSNLNDLFQNNRIKTEESKLPDDSKSNEDPDVERIENELKKLYLMKNQIKNQQDNINSDCELQDIIEEVNFSDLDIKEPISEIDTSVDNDFWDNFELDNRTDNDHRPIPVLRRNKSTSSFSKSSLNKIQSPVHRNSSPKHYSKNKREHDTSSMLSALK